MSGAFRREQIRIEMHCRAPALTTALSSDGRAMAATFDGSRLAQLEAGQNVPVSLAANIIKDGTQDMLWVTTTAAVLK